MKILIYISIVIVSVFSCKKPEDRLCYKSTGEQISESRALNDFSIIVLEDNIKLELTQSSENNATVNTGENLVNFIETTVSGDTLYISNENKCNNLRSRKKEISIQLNIKNIKRINYFGLNGLSSTNTLKSDSLIIEGIDAHGDVSIDFEGNYIATIFHSGTSNIYATGSSKESYAYQISNGFTNYSKLNVKNCHLHSRTIQDCIMNADEKLSVNIQGSGDVYYTDKPYLIIDQKGIGSGELISQ